MKKNNKFNLAKAIKEISNGGNTNNLTGYEAEAHNYQMEKYKQRGLSVSPNTIAIPSAFTEYEMLKDGKLNIGDGYLYANKEQDKLYKQYYPLTDSLGVQNIDADLYFLKENVHFYDDKYDAYTLDMTDFMGTAEVGEEYEKPEIKEKKYLDVINKQHFVSYSIEAEKIIHLAHSPLLLDEANYALNKLIEKDLYNKILDINEVSDITETTIMELINEVDNNDTGLVSPAFLAERSLYNTLSNLKRTNDEYFLTPEFFNKGKYLGWDIYNTDVNQLPENHLIFGDWKRAVIFNMSNILLSLDPYTLADEGRIIFRFRKFANGSASPNHFVSTVIE